MAKRRYFERHERPAAELPPDLECILRDLESPDPATRASAVRRLCPCRGTPWEVPVFPRVWEMRDDPSPVVRHAVQHDLEENPWWGEREEARRLAGNRARRELEAIRDEIDAGAAAGELPGPHSLAWRRPRRPRVRKGHYPKGRR